RSHRRLGDTVRLAGQGGEGTDQRIGADRSRDARALPTRRLLAREAAGRARGGVGEGALVPRRPQRLIARIGMTLRVLSPATYETPTWMGWEIDRMERLLHGDLDVWQLGTCLSELLALRLAPEAGTF